MIMIVCEMFLNITRAASTISLCRACSWIDWFVSLVMNKIGVNFLRNDDDDDVCEDWSISLSLAPLLNSSQILEIETSAPGPV